MRCRASMPQRCARLPFRALCGARRGDRGIAFLATPRASPEAETRIDTRAGALVDAIRARAVGGFGGIEDFLHEYSLSTKEGLALMVLAEALLRVPDATTADRLIEDKLSAGDWTRTRCARPRSLVSASAWALGITARVIGPGETPESILTSWSSRLGRPAVRTATRQAMRLLGSHFVLGQTIEEALRRAAARIDEFLLFLRHARRGRPHRGTMPSATSKPMPTRSRRSARPRATPPCRSGRASRSSFRRCIRATRRCRATACLSRVGAEAARTRAHGEGAMSSTSPSMPKRPTGWSLSLDVDRPRRCAIPRSPDWDGFGLAVQAYQKRAGAVIDWVADTAARARAPADGAPRQGRLLGHRGQARPGARACRLSGVLRARR